MSDQNIKIKKYGTTCSAFGCFNKQRAGCNLPFFRIPKDPERAKAWVIACNRQDLLEKPADVLYKNNRVCSLHFEDRMYTNLLKYRLLPSAIPTIFHNTASSKRKSSDEKLCEEPAKKIRVLSSVKLKSSNNPPKFGEILRHYLTERAPTTPISSSSNKPPEHQWLYDSRPSTSKCNFELVTLTVDATDPISSSVSIPTSASLSLNTPKEQELKEKEMEPKSPDKKTLENFDKACDYFLPSAFAEFIKLKARLSSKEPKGRKFSAAYEEFALGLYFLGPLAYNFFTKLFSLPSKLCLQSMTKRLIYRPGLTNEAFNLLKIKVDTFLEQDKHCILCIDEMPLRTNLFYHIGRDEIRGVVDLGNDQKEFVPAHNASVIMARGLYNNWKQPIAYHFTQSSFAAAEIRGALEECITRLSNIGLIVDAFISDMGSNFIELANILGITPENPAFTVGERDVLFLFDTPCLLKATRNNLLVNQLQFNGKLTSWSYIKSFYERDKMQVSRRAWKLTDSHISPNSFEKMEVELAAQVLSYTVAGGMNTYVSLCALPSEAMATVEVIGKFNNLFDILNSSSVKSDAKYGNAFRGEKYQLRYLNESIDFIKSLKVYDKNGVDITPRVKFLNSWLVTINGIKKLWEKTKASGFKCLMTRRVNQDCLKDFFSSVWQQERNCVNPTTIQFEKAFRKLFCRHFFHTGTTNGEDIDQLLTKFKDLKCNIDAEETTEDQASSVLTLHEQDYRNIDLLTQNAFINMCGYLMEKVLAIHKCDVCLELATTDDLEISRLLTYFKAYDDDGCVVNAPNELFLQYIYKLEVLFFSKFEEFSTKKGIGLAYFKEMERINLVHNCPDFPREYLIKLFIRLRIFNSVKFANKMFRTGTSSTGSKRNRKISILRLDG